MYSVYSLYKKKKTLTKLVLFLFIQFSLYSLPVKSQPNVIETETKQTLNGVASYYSNRFEGRKTASGEVFSQKKMTAACNKLPIGTFVRVIHLGNNKSISVKINDRLHHKSKRLIDLTQSAASKLNMLSSGLAKVRLEVITKEEFELMKDTSN